MIDFAGLFTLIAVSLGLLFFVAGTVAILRFPDPLSRLHGLTKADVLGLGLVVLGLLAQVTWPFEALKLIALWLLVVIAGSIAGQLVVATEFAADDAPSDRPEDAAASAARSPAAASAVADAAKDPAVAREEVLR